MLGAVGLLVCLTAAAVPAVAAGGHLPGFRVADRRVAIEKLPESLRFVFGGIPGAKGNGVPHGGHGPVWFGEARRPKGTVYVGGNGRWVCASEVRAGEAGGGASCTTPAAARDLGLLAVGACGKAPPRHFRVYALVPDGIAAFEIEKPGGKIGRTVPVVENTIAFTVGRENIVMRATGGAGAEGLERRLPLAETARRFKGDGRGGCESFTYFESQPPSAARPGR